MARSKQSLKIVSGELVNRGKKFVEAPRKTIPGAIKCPKIAEKTRRYRPGQAALREIRKFQSCTQLLIPASPFHRQIRAISAQLGVSYRWRTDALLAIREAAEAYLVSIFEKTALTCTHAKRVTIDPRDIKLVCRLSKG